ncbi:UNVERIFIED_CONTAM: E3 ubiquitin-protein ligase EL5 [Sesamum radiatum]|uniref:E3 ubiquitin-protein ligase EL5 n=1 Tax=Sesamum radiatum TaxID=300843 RepID=A0AAW2VJI3_SESRA
MAITSSNLLKKFYGGEDHRPAAAIFDDISQCCAVCLDDIRGGDSYRELRECGHCYHSKCIDLWLRSHSTCPLCRTKIPQPQIISVHGNEYYERIIHAFVSTVVLGVEDFLRRLCNPPLNHELTSMLCRNI